MNSNEGRIIHILFLAFVLLHKNKVQITNFLPFLLLSLIEEAKTWMRTLHKHFTSFALYINVYIFFINVLCYNNSVQIAKIHTKSQMEYIFNFYSYVPNTNNFFTYFYPLESSLQQQYTEPDNFKTQQINASTQVRTGKLSSEIKNQKDIPQAKPRKQRMNAKRKEQKNHEGDSFTQRRNITPNNINHILAFVQRKSKSQNLVQKLLVRLGSPQNFSSKRFYCYQNLLREKLHVHVKKETLKQLLTYLDLHSQIFSLEQQLCYNRVCRILVCYYLRQPAKMVILSSQRVRTTSKKDHLLAQRELLQYVLSIDCFQ